MTGSGFRTWALDGVFEWLMQAMIDEAAGRGRADLDLVSVDSTTARAHHHAAGMVLDGELNAALDETVEKERRLRQRGRTPPMAPSATKRTGTTTAGTPGAQTTETNGGGADDRNERRRLRRRNRFRLKAAKLAAHGAG